MVSVCRTEIMDTSHRLVVTPGNLVLPRRSPEIIEFARQMCSPFKVEELNKKTKQMVYRYRKTNDPDHFRHCLNYFLLAGNKAGIVTKHGRNRKPRQTVANNNYARV